MKITIIIPVLNEAANILKINNYLLENQAGFIEDILFIDGGSTDNSFDVFQENNLKYLKSEKGRAKQMNFGAQHANTEILYFLHVDSFPPIHFDQYIVDLIQTNNLAGCFKMKFDKKHWILDICGWLTKFNFKACRGGDQSLFIAKKLFDELKGFNEEYVIYEDNEFISCIYKHSRFKVIPKDIVTSSRRYEKNGIYRLTFYFGMIHLMNFLGFSNIKLLDYYKKYIQ